MRKREAEAATTQVGRLGAEDPSRASGRVSHAESIDRRRIRSGSPFEKTIGFSRAVRVGNRVVVSGTAPIWPDGTVDPDPYIQAKRCFEIIETALREAGASPDQVIRTRMFLTDSRFADAVGKAHGEAFGEAGPAATMVVVKGLLDERWKVEIEAEAQLD
jgi:enamine deaminase RidA (YjgF/YER057c/UK114 family)